MAEFLLMPFGSAGDTFPFIGLGRQLRERGHEVTVITNGYFRKAVRAAQLKFQEHGTEDEYVEVLKNPDIWHPTKGFFAIVGHPRMPQTMQEQHQIIVKHLQRNPKLVVVAGTIAFGARLAQETHGVKLATVHLSPLVFWSTERPPAFPGPAMPRWMPRWGIRLGYWLAENVVVYPTMQRVIGKLRKEMFLPKEKKYFSKWLHSPEMVLAMFPPWYAEPAPDWPKQTRLIGFPLHDVGMEKPLDPAVVEYLRAGEPPLVFTFGSAMQHGQNLFQAAIEASFRLRQRCLLLTQFPEQLPTPLPPHAYHFSYVPLAQVLPHAAALVHHGGIGTTAQALHAGLPQVVTPLAHDQFDNAERVRVLGVGEVVAARMVTAKRLEKALRSVLKSPTVRAAALRYAAMSRHQNSLSEGCAHLEELARWRRQPARLSSAHEKSA